MTEANSLLSGVWQSLRVGHNLLPNSNNNVLIGAGVGRFLVEIIARRMNIAYTEFSELLECDNISRDGSNLCAPAIAIAQLNRLSKIK